MVMIPFTTAERKVLGVAAPQAAQNQVSANYPPAPNPFGLAPRMTGYVNSIYVQAAGADLVEDGDQPGDRARWRAATTSAAAS